jgi:alpha-N-arabinofuranosidase
LRWWWTSGAWLAATGQPRRLLEQQNSQRDALIAALNLNIFARHADRVRVANIAQMINVLQADLHSPGEDAADSDLSRVQDVCSIHDATFVPIDVAVGTYKSGDIDCRVWTPSPPRCRRQVVVVADQSRSQSRRQHRRRVPAPRSRGCGGSALAAPKIDSVNTFEAPVPWRQSIPAKAAGKKLIVKLARPPSRSSNLSDERPLQSKLLRVNGALRGTSAWRSFLENWAWPCSG